MSSKIKQLANRWRLWKAIDDAADSPHGSSRESARFGASAAKELDDALRAAGASERREGPGRLRWSVLSAISSSSQGKIKAPPSANRMRPLLVGVAAMVVVGLGAVIWVTSPAPSGPSDQMAGDGTTSGNDGSGLAGAIGEQFGPQLEGMISESPVQKEASAVMTDVKAAWSFFRARMITPIPLPGSAEDSRTPAASDV